MNKTIGDLTRFIVVNRTNKVWAGFATEQIAASLKRYADEGAMLYTVNRRGDICGVGTWHLDPVNMILYVHDILTTERWAFRALVKQFYLRWPEYQLRACRRTKEKIYNTPAFLQRVLKEEYYGQL